MWVKGIEIELERKKIKNMHLYVLPPDGRVKVTAPKSMKEAMIQGFVEDKLPWIQKQQLKISSRPQNLPLEYVSGEEILLWGIPFQLEIVQNCKKNDVLIDGKTVYLHVTVKENPPNFEAVLNNWYREQLNYEIPDLILKWESILGVSVREWGIKNMKTRWGTCNYKEHRIWFNLQLAKKDPKCLEYVVLHELAHLLVSNHSKSFKDILDRHMPEWKLIKKEMNGLL